MQLSSPRIDEVYVWNRSARRKFGERSLGNTDLELELAILFHGNRLGTERVEDFIDISASDMGMHGIFLNNPVSYQDINEKAYRQVNAKYAAGETTYLEYLEQMGSLRTGSSEDVIVNSRGPEINGFDEELDQTREAVEILKQRDDASFQTAELLSNAEGEDFNEVYDRLSHCLGFKIDFLYRADQEKVDEFWHEYGQTDYSDGERSGVPGQVLLGETPQVYIEAGDLLEISAERIEDDLNAIEK